MAEFAGPFAVPAARRHSAAARQPLPGEVEAPPTVWPPPPASATMARLPAALRR